MYKSIMRLATLYGSATVAARPANLCELIQYAIMQNGNSDENHTNFKQNSVQLKTWLQSNIDMDTILLKT